MAYEVIARKYRPQQFDDVVGQSHVTDTLKNAIRTDRVAHAYLFVGPRGTGKTTTARILAKALNCEKGSSVQPCDGCDACVEIMAGRSLDVLEIDGASNTSVDQVRDLRQNVQYAPARGPYKIYIIDEVHMLSISAFNALLKTLEEPPSHVKFVFATTEPQKVPSTILSRCQRFDLRRIPVRAIVDRLGEIVIAESLEVDDSALLAVARGAEGGMRDAQSALDQLAAFRDGAITEADVLAVFGLVSWSALESLAESVLTGEVASAMETVAALDREGKDLQRLVVELLEHFRNLLISGYRGTEGANDELTEAQWDAVARQAALVDAERLLHIVDQLTETEAAMKQALSRRTLLETCLIRAARAATTIGIDELIKQVDGIRQDIHSHSTGPRNSPGKAVVEAAPPPTPAAPPPPAQPPAEAPNQPGKVADDVPAGLQGWEEVVGEICRAAPLAKSALRASMPVAIDPDSVTIAIDEQVAGQAGIFDQARPRRAVEAVLSRRLGRPVTARFVTRSLQRDGERATISVEEPAAREADEPAPPPVEEPAAPSPASAAATRSRSDWHDDPAVQRVLEVFNGTVSDVQET